MSLGRIPHFRVLQGRFVLGVAARQRRTHCRETNRHQWYALTQGRHYWRAASDADIDFIRDFLNAKELTLSAVSYSLSADRMSSVACPVFYGPQTHSSLCDFDLTSRVQRGRFAAVCRTRQHQLPYPGDDSTSRLDSTLQYRRATVRSILTVGSG